MTLYSLKGQYPTALPFRIKLSNGMTRTDPTKFTDEEIADAGYISVPEKPIPNENQIVFWSYGESIWVVRDKTESELHTESNERRKLIDSERDRRIANGFVFQNKIYDSRPEDQKRIAGATQLAFMAVLNNAQPDDYLWADETPFGWIAQDNTIVLMDAPTVILFGKTAAAWERSHVFAARELKDMKIIPTDYNDDKWWPTINIISE
jgi:hypothetical protein